MAEREREKKNQELKIKRRDYTGYDDDEFAAGAAGMKRAVLSIACFLSSSVIFSVLSRPRNMSCAVHINTYRSEMMPNVPLGLAAVL